MDKGKVVVAQLAAPSLKNIGSEDAVRRVSIYLPPGYHNSKVLYPVIYFLHGFGWSDSLLVAADHIDEVLDKAIAQKKIRPVIVVMPNAHTLYGGSFYTNSSLIGNWSDFVAKDLIAYIDKTFRTIRNKSGRGISGHSMGGHGALKVAMLHPDVFSSVYALSPAVLGFHEEIGPGNPGFQRIAQVKSREELLSDNEFATTLFVALGRAFSPNADRPPFFADMPFYFSGDSAIVHEPSKQLWQRNMPLYQAGLYQKALRKLKAIHFDWGSEDEFRHIPATCRLFSRELYRLRVPHTAVEYAGTHGSKIMTDDGRMINHLLPFFNTQLKFATSQEK